ncbi:hypothetical protein [Paraburkholderia jirisanensis]
MERKKQARDEPSWSEKAFRRCRAAPNWDLIYLASANQVWRSHQIVRMNAHKKCE